jgi:hypothetical protein
MPPPDWSPPPDRSGDGRHDGTSGAVSRIKLGAGAPASRRLCPVRESPRSPTRPPSPSPDKQPGRPPVAGQRPPRPPGRTTRIRPPHHADPATERPPTPPVPATRTGHRNHIPTAAGRRLGRAARRLPGTYAPGRGRDRRRFVEDVRAAARDGADDGAGEHQHRCPAGAMAWEQTGDDAHGSVRRGKPGRSPDDGLGRRPVTHPGDSLARCGECPAAHPVTEPREQPSPRPSRRLPPRDTRRATLVACLEAVRPAVTPVHERGPAPVRREAQASPRVGPAVRA